MAVRGLAERAITSYIDSVTETRQPDGMIHPSSASMCDRRTVYMARSAGSTEDFDDKTKRKFYIGHRIHEAVQRAFESSPEIDEFYPEASIELHAPYNMKGSADGVILINGKYYIVEVKSISKGSLRFGGMPKEHHEAQAEMYAFGVQEAGFIYPDLGVEIRHLPVKVEGILYVYLEKENMDIYEYYKRYTKAKHENVKAHLLSISEYIDDGLALPKRLPLTQSGKKQWPCNYCPFAEQCWKIDPPEITIGGF